MIEKTTLTVSSDKLPGKDLPDGTAASQAGGTNGSMNGYTEVWGKNPWRQTSTEPEGKSDMFAGDLPDPDNEPKGPISAADVERGWKEIPEERTPLFSRDDTGEEPVGDPFTYGGFLARPRGTAR